jgi:hypothetical protein
MKDCELTIGIDMRKFPEDFWTGDRKKPFMRLNPQQMDDVEGWVLGQLPNHNDFCAELIGRVPIPVAALIGGLLMDAGCQKLTCVHPGSSVLTVWDNTEAAQ